MFFQEPASTSLVVAVARERWRYYNMVVIIEHVPDDGCHVQDVTVRVLGDLRGDAELSPTLVVL